METFLLLVAIALLLVDFDEHRTCHDALAASRDDGASITSQVRRAEHRITAMTDQAVQALLDEAKRWEPGGEE